MGGACSKSKKHTYIMTESTKDIAHEIAQLKKEHYELLNRVNNIILMCEMS